MRGFEDPSNPVYISLDPVVNTLLNNTPNAPYQIDPAVTEATTYGVLTTVNNVRYFIPWAKVYLIRQQQPAVVNAPPVGTALK